MKRWLKSSRIWALCLAAILLIGIEIPVQASPESGTLKVHLKENRFRVEFAVYKVAEYTDGEYPLTSDFAGINDKVENAENRVDLNKLTNASQMKACAEKLIKWADEKNISPMYQAYTEDGVLDLGEVPLGMFLVRQISHKEDQILVTPALLGVPYWKVVTENGEQHKVLEYTVESEPKESVEIPETEKPCGAGKTVRAG